MIALGIPTRGRRVGEAPSSHVGVSYPAGSSWRHSASRGLDVTIKFPRTGLEHAIGVIGWPETEVASHYFEAELPLQFNQFIWLDQTSTIQLPTTGELQLLRMFISSALEVSDER